MRPGDSHGKQASLLSNLTGLLIASLVCIAILTVAVAGSGQPTIGDLSARELVIGSVLAGAFLFLAIAVGVLIRAARATRRFEEKAANAVADLQRQLNAAHAIISSEPMTLVVWEHRTAPRVIINALNAVPEAAQALLQFRGWLEPTSAAQLEERLEALFRRGRAFNLLATTSVGVHLEFDGRAAGRRAVLKIRDVAGERLMLADAAAERRRFAEEFDNQRALFNSLPMLVWFRDARGRITWANHAFVNAVEATSPREIVERQIDVLNQRQRDSVGEALMAGRSHRERMHLIVKGERRAYDVITVPLGARSASFASDASGQETAEGALSRQIEAHDRTLDRVSTAVATFGQDQKLSFFNEAYQRLWNLDAGWLASQPRHGDILDRLREHGLLPVEADYKSWKERQLSAYRRNEDQEDCWHLPDGRALHVVAEQRPDGGMTWLFDDVTERFALETRYNELIGVQRETLDHLQEGVAVFATDGRLRLFNPAFARIWKQSPKQLQIGPHIDEVIGRCRTHYDDARVWTRIKRSVTAIPDSRQRIEGQMNRPDGSVVAYAALPLPDGATLVTFLDISDRKRVELALIERNEALEAADRLKSDFISHVSYELRTPLTNIIGFSELLSSPRVGELNEKQREYLGDINASSNALQTIINDILDLATIDAGTFELRLGTVDIREAIRIATEAVKERLARVRLGLDVQVGPEVGTFEADANRVSHVLYNLLSNAIGFSNQGDTIRLVCTREDGMIVFVVEDQGCGIPEDQHDKVFERFESYARRGKHRGAGLGLAIVKSLVELHGGDVQLRSRAGDGTAVTVRFPADGLERRAPRIGEASEGATDEAAEPAGSEAPAQVA